jgi:hypothetical protein
MSLSIQNSGAIMTADLNVLGAAVKIIWAGGSQLTDNEMKRASGASYHLWKSKGDVIRALVENLEAVPEPSGR